MYGYVSFADWTELNREHSYLLWIIVERAKSYLLRQKNNY